MPRYRQKEIEEIQQSYSTGCELAKSGSLEDALPYFDIVLGRLPRKRRDRVYRIQDAATPSHKYIGVTWLPPIFRDALIAKAYCLNELGRFEDAFILLERAVELDPENPQVYAELGFAHGSRDNLEKARSAYLTASQLEPANASYHCALAHISLMSDQFEEARVFAQVALVIDPHSVIAHQQMAYAAYRMSDVREAIAWLLKAVALDPDNVESVLRLAGALQEMGETREAIVQVKSYLQRQPRDQEALAMMTELLQQDGSAPEAIPHAEALLARNACDPIGLDLLAWSYYQRGQFDKAVDALRRLIRVEPYQATHHFKLGVVSQSLGDIRQAMASMLRAISLDSPGEIKDMAEETIRNLDQVQIDQLLHRAYADPDFGMRLMNQPDLALHQAGYLLSPAGMQFLLTLDLVEEIDEIVQTRTRTLH